MRVGVLTSSRADYGIYLPLLKALKEDKSFELKVIAFGTHLSPFHGKTIAQIYLDGFEVSNTVESLLAGDSKNAISTAMSLTSLKFADFWKEHNKDFDIVFCLGDRYEMFAAVTAGIPYGIRFAHLHGGERTLGAIDNVFRHSITLASSMHFVSTKEYSERVVQLTENNNNIYVTGALSLDNIENIELLSIKQFKNRFDIDLSLPTILSTFHPETVDPQKNQDYAKVLFDTFKELSEKYQIVITLPNADTEGVILRDAFLKLPKQTNNRLICVENLGTLGYFSCMKHCKMLLGNTSSGIIEAASFKRWVIDLGDRQKGRACSENVVHCEIEKKKIISAIKNIEDKGDYMGENIYYQGGAVRNIMSVLKRIS